MSLTAESGTEQARLASLYQYEILDTDAEEFFDEITRFASFLFQVPVAYISLVDVERVWFKSITGLDAKELLRGKTFCQFTIAQPEKVLIVDDALKDPRFNSLHFVTSEIKCRFFAGVPPVTPDGYCIGTLGIADKTPRTFDMRQAELLQSLAKQVMALFDLRLRERQLKKSIEQKEENDRVFFEDSSDVVFICSADGLILEINETGVKLFGAEDKKELLAKNIRELYWEPEAYDAYVEAVSSQGFLKNYESTLRNFSGEKLHVLVNSSALYENGQIVAYRGVLRDITHVSQLQEQLFQAQKIEAIGQLAGGVAHDFNNILMAISAFAELALWDLAPDSKLRETMSEIIKSTDQGASLTQQLLAFSRRQMMQPKILDINEILAGMENFLKRLLREDVDLIPIFDKGAGRIKADPSKVEQVVMNLVVNARDAMPDGGKLIIETSNVEMDEDFVSHHAGSRPGRYVMLTVSDTGVGMSEGTIARIFEPFFSTKDQGKGTGLGLSTVYGIVKQSDGYISVYSEPGHGTAFRVYFPRVDAAADPIKTDSADKEVSVSGDETILIVDDNEPVRRSIGAFLETKGYKVLQAGDGIQSLELVRQHAGPVHLVITDMVMPSMSGLALARSLRQLRPNIRVLCISGYSREAIEHQDRIDHGADFLSKPVSMSVLLGKVREILDRRA